MRCCYTLSKSANRGSHHISSFISLSRYDHAKVWILTKTLILTPSPGVILPAEQTSWIRRFFVALMKPLRWLKSLFSRILAFVH